MAITIYDVPKSGHCHRVRLAASLMKIDTELVAVMEMEGQRQGAEYLAINPIGQVPAINDKGFVLTDSIAIIQYLARKFAPKGTWIPESLEDQARVDEWLAFAAGMLFRGPNTARLVKLFGMPLDYDAAVTISKKAFERMDKHLDGRTWLVGDRATLADIACYSYVAVANEGELELSPYPNIAAWLSSVQGLDGFVDIPRSSAS